MVLRLSKRSPKPQYHSTRAGNGIENKSSREDRDGSRCRGTAKMPVGFPTLWTYHHTELSGALGPHEDDTRVFAAALETSPSIKMEKVRRYLSSSFSPLPLC